VKHEDSEDDGRISQALNFGWLSVRKHYETKTDPVYSPVPVGAHILVTEYYIPHERPDEPSLDRKLCLAF
jgi:hypothetical protein